MTTTAAHPALTIPVDAWQTTVGTRLLTTIQINGVTLHLEAIEVTEHAGVQYARQREDRADLHEIAAAVGADGPFATTSIHGRDYVLVATPYCD